MYWCPDSFFTSYKNDLPFSQWEEQVFLGHSGGLDTDGNELPRLVYVSREKRPGFQHHKKAGAMNALVCHLNASYLLSLQFGLLSIFIDNGVRGAYLYMNAD